MGSHCILVCLLVLVNLLSTSSYNLNARIMNLATKRIAAVAIVAAGLTGLPDQIFQFSPSSMAMAATQDVKSIFDGNYNDPNHPGCMVRMLTDNYEPFSSHS